MGIMTDLINSVKTQAQTKQNNTMSEAAVSQSMGWDQPQMPAPVRGKPNMGFGKRNDFGAMEAMKPIGSFKNGTPRVPKTGNYLLHEGEDVISKEKNMGVVDDIGKIAGAVRAKADAVKTDTENATRKTSTPAPTPAPKSDTGKRYGDKAPEKRMDVTEALKPLGSFKNGTSHVPKTGVYKLHEGEAVIPKDTNMNASTAMEKITGKKGVPEKKIHKITTHKTDDGKMIHTHQHHHPMHHPDETHVSNNVKEAQDHMEAMEPQMSAQPPAMPEAAPAAGAAPAMPGM